MSETAKQPETAQTLAGRDEMQGGPPSAFSLPPRMYLRKDQAANWLGVSERCLEDWQRAKVIPYVKVGRVILFRVDALDRALQRFTIKAVGDFQKA